MLSSDIRGGAAVGELERVDREPAGVGGGVEILHELWPIHGALADNGGAVPTLALTSASPARDTAVTTAEVPPTDARGLARVGPPDRGSFEFDERVAQAAAASIGGS